MTNPDYRKVAQIGNSSYQIVIPKDMVKSLKLGKGDYVQLALEDNKIIISRVKL